jgi:hypothetical protein
MVSAFFTKANLAALVGMVVFVLGYLPFVVVTALMYKLTWSTKTGAVSGACGTTINLAIKYQWISPKFPI